MFPRVLSSLSITLLLTGFLAAQNPSAPPPIPSELKAVKDKYENQRSAMFRPLNELETNYRSALEHTKESASRQGHLETVMAVNEIVKNLDAGVLNKPVRAREIEALRQVFVEQRNEIIRGLREDASKATIGYLEQLHGIKLKLQDLHRPEDAAIVAKEEETARKELKTLSGDNPLAAPAQRTPPPP